MIVSRFCLLESIQLHMVYLISEILLYLLAALLIGFILGWALRGLQQDRYTRSLQIELDKKKTDD